MLLAITTTHQPATDLGYLLHKSPFKAQQFSLSFGRTHVFYPAATAERCTAALMIDVDPVALVRNRSHSSGEGGLLDQYVNDRPYVASSFLSVAIGDVYRSALGGRCTERPELVETEIPLEAYLPVVPCRGGERLLSTLFEPLGYTLETNRLPLDEKFPEWGKSVYFSLRLSATKRLRDLLAHLYVLIPVLDNNKHYWIGDEEVEKLLRHGGDWLATHPEREQIVRRYLKHRKSLARQALERLIEEDTEDETEVESVADANALNASAQRETALEAPLSLNENRTRTVVGKLREFAAPSVIDLGCGEGKLLSALLKEKQITKLVGLDVSMRALEIAKERLNLDRLPTPVREKLTLLHGALTYRDARISGFAAATVIEVIEHLDQARLSAFERVLFEFAKPKAVIVTTPNIEYNVKFEDLAAGQLRHPDHRFEWTRAEFQSWASGIAERFRYQVSFASVGADDPVVGAPTQMAIFQQAS